MMLRLCSVSLQPHSYNRYSYLAFLSCGSPDQQTFVDSAPLQVPITVSRAQIAMLSSVYSCSSVNADHTHTGACASNNVLAHSNSCAADLSWSQIIRVAKINVSHIAREESSESFLGSPDNILLARLVDTQKPTVLI